MREYRKFEMLLARLAGKACRVLHLTSPVIASFELSVDGNPVMRSKSNSWVRNMINMMAAQGMLGATMDGDVSFFQDGYLNMRTLAGTIWKNDVQSNILYAMGLNAGSDRVNTWGSGSDWGIVVGSSDSAESFNDYKLAGIIAHGNDAGQLYRNAQNVLSRAWDSGNRKWVLRLQRAFVNNSGGAISVKELGFYTRSVARLHDMYGDIDGAQVTEGTMLLRDVLPTAQTVNNGQTITVTYQIEYQY